jgi:SAM-dependent methyltransferase
MPSPAIITKVDPVRWSDAQSFEMAFAQNVVNRGDDHNYWWRKQFDNYKILRNLILPNVLEVGCGPHTNVRMILPLIKFQSLILEDPLINSYLRLEKIYQVAKIIKFHSPVEIMRLYKKHQASLHLEPLEDLYLPDNSIDLCICINVLDHVRDADTCLKQIERVTKKGGIVIIGQDLSNQEDQKLCPESWEDAGHPIKLDDLYLDVQLGYLDLLYKKILTREKGRNPRCHYGTYLLIGKK